MAGKHLLLAAAIAAALAAGSARAAELAFSFTGAEADTNTPFSASFDVNTLDPGNRFVDTFDPNGQLSSISLLLVSSDFNATLGGVPLAVNTAGSLSLTGIGPVAPGAFFGPALSLSGGSLTLLDGPHFSFPVSSEAALQGSSDPLALLLNGSQYGSDDPGYVMVDGQMVSTQLEFTGSAVAVPEPGIFGLLLLGFFGSIIVGPLTKRRRVCAN